MYKVEKVKVLNFSMVSFERWFIIIQDVSVNYALHFVKQTIYKANNLLQNVKLL